PPRVLDANKDGVNDDNDRVIAQIGNQATYGINYDILPSLNSPPFPNNPPSPKLYFRAVLPDEPNYSDPAFQGDRLFRLQYSYVQQTPAGSVHSSVVLPLLSVPWKAPQVAAPPAWQEVAIPAPPGFNNWDPTLRLELDSIQLSRRYADISASN